MNWFAQHMGVTGATGTGVIAIGGLFLKDWVREWWQDWRDERRAVREARAIERNKGDRLANELLGILKQDLQESRLSIKELTTVLERLSVAIEHLAQVSDETFLLAKATRESTLKIEGALQRGSN